MEKAKQFIFDYLHVLIVLGVALLCGIFIIFGGKAEDGSITLDKKPAKIEESTTEWIENARKEYKAIINYSEESVPAIVSTENGEETIDVPTVESIDNNEPFVEKCPKDTECGRGTYIYAPTDSYYSFRDYTIGKCWDVDGWYGAQCWDLSSLFSMNYTPGQRVFSTCGTGAAKGMWDCREENAGDEFILIYDPKELQEGDIAVFGGGTWGHTGVVAGRYNNGYVALLGQNQGGNACPGGGASTNIINMSTSTFLGAFRPKTYVKPEPTPTPTPTPKEEGRYVVSGDTMSGIMLEQEGYVEWGESMNQYADSWCSTLVVPGQSIFYGWTHNTGYGLYANDIIKPCDEL